LSSLICPVDLDTRKLREEVRAMYARVASEPSAEFHFHTGAAYAAGMLGYDEDALAAIPAATTRAFAGVGNPHAIAPIEAGATVLDVGCGAGTDLLLAARAVGASGRAIGVDMTDEMIARARASAAEMRADHVEIVRGELHDLPIPSGSIDVVISNGVLNLSPDKPRAMAELFRVLRPGGRMQLTDIVVDSELPDGVRRDVDLWTA
jgi:arsenite methyltransferase